MPKLILCEECGGELKPKVDFFKQKGEKHYQEMKEKFKKEFGQELPEPEGYNCIKCGACYSTDFKREKFNIGWIKKNGNE